MVKLADTPALGAGRSNPVEVQVLSPAHKRSESGREQANCLAYKEGKVPAYRQAGSPRHKMIAKAGLPAGA